MEPGSVYFGLREKKNFPVPCSECILLSALFSSRRTDCPEHIHISRKVTKDVKVKQSLHMPIRGREGYRRLRLADFATVST
jgi:hypothetical protein